MVVVMETDERGPESEPETQQRPPDWWHRDHPVFTPLAGFFTGLLCAIVVPGAFAAILGLIFDYDTVERLFPLVLVTLAIPLAMLVPHGTRRFARYLLIGIVSTLVVVLGVAALVIWCLVKFQS